MVSYLLNTIYLGLLVLCMPWILFTAVRKGKYRQGLAAQLLGHVPIRMGNRPCIWLHAVSVGEVRLLATLLKQINRDLPDYECVVSTSTRTGYALATKEYADRIVFYCPRDFSWAVKTALQRIRPDILLLAELELWPNLIHLAHRRGTKLVVVNGRLGEKSFRGYQRVRPFVRGMLDKIDIIAAQNETYAERFRSLGAPISRVHVTGSLKFDGAETSRENPRTRELAALASLSQSDFVFLAGSTQPPEEEIALTAFLSLMKTYPQLRLILVPRHPERFNEVAHMLERSGEKWQRRSELKESNQQTIPSKGKVGERTDNALSPPRILLVDTMGELGAWWGTAHFAYVGGSMGSRGGQNMIEPAAYGAVVSFGPKTRNFRDIVAAMRQADAAIVVEDLDGLTAMLRRCFEQPAWAAAMGRRAQDLVLSQLGATQRTAALLIEMLAPLHGETQKTAP